VCGGDHSLQCSVVQGEAEVFFFDIFLLNINQPEEVIDV
jgi:hypothetical protein